MVLVPSYLEIDGLVVPLQAYEADAKGPAAVGQRRDSLDSPLIGLAHVTGDLLAKHVWADVKKRLETKQNLVVSQELCASLVPGQYASDFELHGKNWERLTGTWPDLSDSYVVGTAFLDDRLVIPRTTFLKLMKKLYELNEEVRAGRMEPKIDRSIPMPLPRPEPLVVPPGSWADEELEEFENLLRRLDELDPLVAALADPSRKLTREVLERRASVFGLLEICEARDRTGADLVLARARAHGYAVTCSYFAALAELRAYLASSARLEVLAGFGGGQATAPAAVQAELARPLLAVASIDLFRLPRPAHPADLSYHQWLAWCEGTFRYDPLVTEHLPSPSEGTCGDLFTRLRRVSTRLRYRTEHGKRLHLWRAELA